MLTKEKLLKLLNGLVHHISEKDYMGNEYVRHLGGIEMLLITLGVLKAGEPLPKEKYEAKHWFWGTKRVLTETYHQVILRLAKETLEKEDYIY